MSFFSELKRRNVFRVALLYAIASWILLQVADVGSSILELPGWVSKFVFLILLIGLPLVLIFSWVYEITPEGLQKEASVDSTQSIVHKTASKLNAAVIVLLLLAITGLVVDRFLPEYVRPEPAGNSVVPEASIAVLRFRNMSSDEENEYFSEGLSEELLNLLARIPGLRVAARTSAFSFAGSNADAIEIGAALNVAHVLEGSVRKSGDTVRITAQLIDADDGYHIWSETWDRQLDDIFEVQDEISAAVVESLKIALLGEVPAARAVNSEAYTLYLRAKSAGQVKTDENLQRAADLLQEALEIEPGFADAWSALATMHINRAGRYFVSQDEGFSLGRAATERALEIDPDNATARSGLCWILMYYEYDFSATDDCVRDGLASSPANASTLNTAGTFYRNIGRHDLAIDAFQKALETDPISASIHFNLAIAYVTAARLGEAQMQLEVVRSLYPEDSFVDVVSAAIMQRRGDAEMSLAISEEIPGQMGNWMRGIALHDLEKPDDVERVLQELEMSGARDAPFIIASIHAYRGDTDAAFAWLERALENGDDNLVELRGGYLFDKLEADSRWQPFLAKVGISDADLALLGY